MATCSAAPVAILRDAVLRTSPQDEVRRLRASTKSHAPPPRTMSERPAIRFAAVPAGRWADAGFRHHGPRQSGAWLVLHAGGLFRRDLRGAHGKLRARLAAGAGCDPPGR